MIILFNNKFISKKDAKISIFSTSFMYGHGAFETLRTYNKKIFKTNEHIDRLFKSAKAINLHIKYSKEDLKNMLKKVTKKSIFKSQRIKLIAINEGIFITSIKLSFPEKIYRKGVDLKSIKISRNMAEAKTLAYLDSYLAHQKAEQEKYYEALLVGENNEIFEGAYSNIFWFEENTLCTKKTGILKGITRETIFKISPFKIKFSTIKLTDLLKKQEIFITQTTKGIIPIRKIDTNLINNGIIGQNTKSLMKIFENYVKFN